MLNFIPDKNLKELDNYKYNGGEYTTIDNLFNIFWVKSIQYMPRFLHPNMITLLGFASVFVTTGLFFFYGNPLVDNVPGWLYLLQ